MTFEPLQSISCIRDVDWVFSDGKRDWEIGWNCQQVFPFYGQNVEMDGSGKSKPKECELKLVWSRQPLDRPLWEIWVWAQGKEFQRLLNFKRNRIIY